MNQINFKNNPIIRRDIEPLYVSAFPIEERPPEKIFFEKAYKDTNDLIAFYENGEFIGFTDLLSYQDICYVFFLAVTPQKRGQGYGSKIIEEIKKIKSEKTLFLCYEEIDEKYKDNSLRIKRRDFYYKNGFKDNNLKTKEYGVLYDTCYYGKRQVKFDEYLSLMIDNYSEWVKKFIKKAS